MAERSQQHQKVEYRMHIPSFVQGVEKGACYIRHSLPHQPSYGLLVDSAEQRAESCQDAKAHRHITQRLEITMPLQPTKGVKGSGHGAQANKNKQTNTPMSLRTKRHQRHRSVRTGNMPIYRHMIPIPETTFPRRAWRHGVIHRAGQIRIEHTKQIEQHAGHRHRVACARASFQKHRASHHAQHNTGGMAPSVPSILG